jgi:hypothetical protein
LVLCLSLLLWLRVYDPMGINSRHIYRWHLQGV